jgi:transcription initiation factor IIE alpha subunit
MWQTGIQMLMTKREAPVSSKKPYEKKEPQGYSRREAAQNAHKHYLKITEEKMENFRNSIVDSIKRGKTTAEEITKELGYGKSHIRTHLRLLKKKGIIDFQKGASGIYYWKVNGS